MILTVRTIAEFCRKALEIGSGEIGIAPVFASLPFDPGYHHFGCVELTGFGAYELHAVIPIDTVVTKSNKLPEQLYDTTDKCLELVKKGVSDLMGAKTLFVEGVFGISQVAETCETFFIAQHSKIAKNVAVIEKENAAAATK
jgi:hypothetical protein